MKQIKLKGLSLVLLLLCSLSTWSASYDFVEDGIYYNINDDDTTVSVTYFATYASYYTGDVVIPSTVTHDATTYSVTGIGEKAFYLATELTSVTIPNSVKSIGNQAFSAASSSTPLTSLTKVTFEEGSQLETIGNSVFLYCTSLDSLEIPSSVTSIGTTAFKGCTSLKQITYNAINCTTTAANEADIPFYGCDSLTSITIGEEVETIPAYMFDGYKSSYFPNLTSITIPNSVKTIADYAFSYCESLKTLNFDESAQLDTIGNYAFHYCISLDTIEIPANVKSIGTSAFAGDGSHPMSLAEVSFGEDSQLETIGDYAFNYCTNLETVVIPNSVKSIVQYAFFCCSGLKTIEIPDNVESLGVSAFGYCTSLEEIYTSNITPIDCGNNAFYNVPSECVLYVPAGSEDDYSNYSGTQAWNHFTNVTGVYYTSVSDNTITLKAPAVSSEISCDSIAAGDEVIVVADVSGNMTVAIYDTESTDTLYYGDIESVDTISAGTYKYTWTCPNDITFYDGHSYTLAIAMSDDETENAAEPVTLITYTGTTENIVLDSVTPDESEAWTEAEDKDIVLTFTGLVKVEEAYLNGQTALDATGSDTTEEGYSSEWTITVSADDVATYNGSSISISVTAVNQNGNTIYDEDGNDISLSYQIGIDDGVYDGYTFDPEDSTTVSSLSSITVGYTLEYDEDENIIGGGLGLGYNNSEIEICDSTNTVVATLTADDNCEEIYGSDDSEDPAYYVCTSIVISFDEIVDDGVYTVIIPAGFFNLISGDTSKSSGQITLTYTVDSTTTGINAINAAVNAGAEVYNLSGQRIGTPMKGAVNIIKYADGSVKKVLVK